jgi:hypothetical protein
MTDEEQTLLVEIIRGEVPPLDGVLINKLHTVYEPHPYCITASPLATDRMYLDADTIREAEKNHHAKCGMYHNPLDNHQWSNQPPRGKATRGFVRCTLPYDEHTTKYALLVDVTNRVSEEDARKGNADEGLRAWLKDLVPVMEKHGLVGLALTHKSI